MVNLLVAIQRLFYSANCIYSLANVSSKEIVGNLVELGIVLN